MKILLTSVTILMLLFTGIYFCWCQGCKRRRSGSQDGMPCLASEKSGALSKRLMPQIATKAEEQLQLVRRSVEAARPPQVVSTNAKEMLRSTPRQETTSAASSSSIVRLAAEKSQLMDDLLNEESIPSDYGQVMVGLFRDRSQDVYTRDFAVQHIGLYAEALHRRGFSCRNLGYEWETQLCRGENLV